MKPTFQETLACIALLVIGGLGFAMLFVSIPPANATSFTFVLGALAGALTVAGGQKVADKLTSTGPNATINATPETPTPVNPAVAAAVAPQ